MLHSKIFRIILLLVIAASLALISRSLMSRVGSRTEAPEEEILPEEIVRKTTDFEHSQMKNGRVLFRVIAGSSTMTTGGDNVLERVSLWRFDDDGQPSDMIEGEEAVYNPARKKILFTGDVVIRLERGILIYADRVEGNLASETLVIREDYRMEHESVIGQGRGLEYVFLLHRLRFLDRVNLEMDAVADRKEVEAGRGEYLMDSGRIVLEDRVRIESPQSTVRGDRVEALLDSNGQLSILRSWGRARLSAGGSGSFSGDELSLDLRNGLLTVLSSDAGTKSLFQAGGELGSRRISGDAIYCSFTSAPGDSWTLKKIKADGGVKLEFPESSLKDCRGEHFQGELSSGSDMHFETISLSGNVHLVQEDAPGSKGILEGQDLRLELDREGLPELVVASGEVSADLSRPAGPEKGMENYRIEAGDVLRLVYDHGTVREAVARRDCRLAVRTGEQSDRLEADSLRIEFLNGLMAGASAGGKVRGRSEGSGIRRELSSDRLDVSYHEGIFSSFEQSGSVSLRETDSAGSYEISAEKTRFEEEGQVLTAEGGRPVMIITESDPGGIRKIETRATLIRLSQADSLLEAEGEVESIYYREEGSFVFVAAVMKSDLARGQVEYRENVRLLLDENVIQGDKMILDSRSRNLSIEGGVDTKLLTGEGNQLSEYRVVSSRLELDTAAGTASYEGDVRLDSEDFDIEAPFLVVYMEPGTMEGFSRIEAWGGVTIREEGRVWTGERAEYLKETGKVVVDAQ